MVLCEGRLFIRRIEPFRVLEDAGGLIVTSIGHGRGFRENDGGHYSKQIDSGMESQNG